MSAAGVVDQSIAAFALHALWQVPLLALAAWIAVRVGRPTPRAAHLVWVVTLLLAVLAPVIATWQGYRAAREQAQLVSVTISDGADHAAGPLPEMQRESEWMRMVHRHFTLRDGVKPFAFALPARAARAIALTYVLVLMCLCLRFGYAWYRSRLLVRSASRDVPQAIADAIDCQSDAMGCASPDAALSDQVAGPLLAGVTRPTLLLPSAVPMSGQELQTVLAHELAHLRRRDPWGNALCLALALPIGFHPAAMWIANRIRQTREMACDADAVAYIGSATRYADALLRVAERMMAAPAVFPGVGLSLLDVRDVSSATVRDGRPWTPLRSATADLELFGARGAMEERMCSMMKHEVKSRRAVQWTRGIAVAAIAATGVAAACMVQVQPALAAQQQTQAATKPAAPAEAENTVEDTSAPALVSGARAQRQLREASRRLNDAESKAATDEDRSKIAAAQQAIHMAQSELSAEGAPQPFTIEIDPNLRLEQLSSMTVHLKELRKLNSDAIRLQQSKLQAGMEEMQKKLNSPEFQVRIQKQAEDAARMQARVESPEILDRIQKQAADAIRMQEKMDSPEFRARIDREVADASRQMQQLQKQAALMAKNDPPVMAVVPQDAEKPMQVKPGVMAGNIRTKIQPVYPASAKEAKIQGEVVLHAIIDETGKVEQVAVVSSPDDALTKSAIDAVRQWTYRPYLLNGQPRAVDTTITVHYTLAQ